MRAFLADGLDAEGDAGAVDQADQLAEPGRRGDDRLAVGFLG